MVMLMMWSVWPLLIESALILLQTVPTHIDIEKLKRIFAEGRYPHYNIKDENGYTPLFFAAQEVAN